MEKQTTRELLRSKMPVVEPVIMNSVSSASPEKKMSSIWEVTEEYGGSFCGCGCSGCMRVSHKNRKS